MKLLYLYSRMLYVISDVQLADHFFILHGKNFYIEHYTKIVQH